MTCPGSQETLVAVNPAPRTGLSLHDTVSNFFHAAMLESTHSRPRHRIHPPHTHRLCVRSRPQIRYYHSPRALLRRQQSVGLKRYRITRFRTLDWIHVDERHTPEANQVMVRLSLSYGSDHFGFFRGSNSHRGWMLPLLRISMADRWSSGFDLESLACRNLPWEYGL